VRVSDAAPRPGCRSGYQNPTRGDNRATPFSAPALFPAALAGTRTAELGARRCGASTAASLNADLDGIVSSPPKPANGSHQGDFRIGGGESPGSDRGETRASRQTASCCRDMTCRATGKGRARICCYRRDVARRDRRLPPARRCRALRNTYIADARAAGVFGCEPSEPWSTTCPISSVGRERP